MFFFMTVLESVGTWNTLTLKALDPVPTGCLIVWLNVSQLKAFNREELQHRTTASLGTWSWHPCSNWSACLGSLAQDARGKESQSERGLGWQVQRLNFSKLLLGISIDNTVGVKLRNIVRYFLNVFLNCGGPRREPK